MSLLQQYKGPETEIRLLLTLLVLDMTLLQAKNSAVMEQDTTDKEME